MFKFSAVSQIWKKYIQKLNDWDLPLNAEKTIKVRPDRQLNKCKMIYTKDTQENVQHAFFKTHVKRTFTAWYTCKSSNACLTYKMYVH